MSTCVPSGFYAPRFIIIRRYIYTANAGVEKGGEKYEIYSVIVRCPFTKILQEMALKKYKI